ncbi:MAG: 16S rRNA (cytosine(1402)-N(4))-methyltransferase RsmH [Candidatus Pacebacteria bacterium]|nr:16S rRNA (cytosine(1402)-N(4))-methyltransferase RsmH [Candidatus Paceibacterota bacterium]
MEEKTTAHIPVLLQEVIDVLTIAPDDCVLDGTAGGGGHAEAILRVLGSTGRYIGIDADATAIERVRARLHDDPRVTLICGNFRTLDELACVAGVTRVTKILLDLGLSSDQLTGNGRGRGFTFQTDEPLVMTLDANPTSETLTAREVVNEWAEESLADVIYGFGGEPRARKIARAIVTARAEAPIETSQALAGLVEASIGRRGAIHPATRTFQAIRIAVNDELGALAMALDKSIHLLAPGGRLAVISFHSLEDGLVKRTFRTWRDAGQGTTLTKKPIIPSSTEARENRRARSAKLRAFEKAP